MTSKLRRLNLINKLLNADICCHSCGQLYGKYSVGVSSSWEAKCPICEDIGRCTETRDYGYLEKGIQMLRDEIAAEETLLSQIDGGPVEQDIRAYEQGEITLKLTEEEVGFLNECLDTLQEFHNLDEFPENAELFESIEKKITELYEDNCIKYELSPAMKAYITHYGQIPGPEDDAKWEIFRDAYNLAVIAGGGND